MKVRDKMKIHIRKMNEDDPEVISNSFKEQAWEKPIDLYANGDAQILYANRGYVPDGKGIYNGQRYIEYGDTIVVDDDVVLYLTKALKR